MFRYIGWTWDAGSREQTQLAQRLRQRLLATSAPWRTAADCDDLQIFWSDPQGGPRGACPLQGGAGVVLGTVFERPDVVDTHAASQRKSTFSETETGQIVASQGRQLVTAYWGQYVAFVIDRTTRTKWMLSDPTGGIPCFWTAFQDVRIFFSCVDDTLSLGLPRFSINWESLRSRVALGAIRATSSALNEVHAVGGGECVEISSAQMPTRLLWDPRVIASAELVEHPDDARQLLRAAVRLSVQSWGSCYETVLVRLSGGLDSSIVLGCLADAPDRPRITAHVNYLPSRAGDERAFAQQVVEHTGCEMAVHEKVLADLQLKDLLRVPLTVCPAPDLSHLEVSRIDRQIVRQTGARAVFSGEGGDSLFASRMHEDVVVDFICRHGLRSGVFDLALRIAPLAEMSVWHVLATAVRRSRYHRKPQPSEELTLRCLVSEEALEHARAHAAIPLHPWFQYRIDVPPGKAVHIRSVMHSDTPFHDPLAQPDDPDDIYPLRSQPAIEAALRIPTYTHVHDGRDRGLARQAFSREVPSEVLNRLWKGRPQNFATRQLWGEIGFVRELLLDGLLVQHKLLDRTKLEQALSGPTKMGDSVLEIFDHIITEAWTRRWTEIAQAAFREPNNLT